MSIDKPEIDFPGGEPPKNLEITDVWEGDGAVAKAGDTVAGALRGRRVLHRRGVRRQLEPG